MILSWISLGLFVVGPLFAHFRVIPPFGGFLLWLGGGAVGILALLILAFRVWKGGVGVFSIADFAMALVPALFAISLIVSSKRFPLMNDVTTSPGDSILLADGAPYPEKFRGMAVEFYGTLSPLVLAKGTAPEGAIGRAKAVLESKPGCVLESNGAGPLRLVGYCESSLFRFRDDFALEAKLGGDGIARLEMRSRSRDGRNDFGKNAERIKEVFAEVSKAL